MSSPTFQLPFAPGTTAPETQPFGPTSFTAEPSYEGYAHFHTGLDYGVASGTPILAANAGTITTGWDPGGYGNYIIDKAASGWETLYGHLSQINVNSGAVALGQEIGLSGSTGNSTGPHLHFGLENPSGVWIDPTPYLIRSNLPASQPNQSNNQGSWLTNNPVTNFFGGVGNAIGSDVNRSAQDFTNLGQASHDLFGTSTNPAQDALTGLLQNLGIGKYIVLGFLGVGAIVLVYALVRGGKE